MGATMAEAQTAKKCYKNQTAGWLGVVKLDHLGAQIGHPIPPYGTAWLTDDEALLTARAPALPEDNPFVEKVFQFYDEHQNIVEQPMRQLVLVEPGSEGDPSEAERFVPGQEPDLSQTPTGHDVNLDAAAAAQRDTQAALDAKVDRPVPTLPGPATLVPSATAAVPPSHTKPGAPDTSAAAPHEEDKQESWVENPDRTVTPQPASLAGSNDPAPKAPGEQAPITAQAPAQPPVQQTPAQADVPTQTVVPSENAGTQTAAGAPSEQPAASAAEEHAGVTEKGEETGAAQTPVGEPPEGEFASHEEVGSPDAPTQVEPKP